MDNKTLLVSGLGRCGSSLTLQMLEAGGFPCVGQYPAYEPEKLNPSKFDAKWFMSNNGKAIKFIMPEMYDYKFPASYSPKAIWIDRDPLEQARSSLKLMRVTVGFEAPDEACEEMASQYDYFKKNSIAALYRITSKVLFYKFEDILNDPAGYSKSLANWVGVDLSIDDMVNQVIKRDYKSTPDMSIELELIRNRGNG